jgi:hypothetical protein
MNEGFYKLLQYKNIDIADIFLINITLLLTYFNNFLIWISIFYLCLLDYLLIKITCEL